MVCFFFAVVRQEMEQEWLDKGGVEYDKSEGGRRFCGYGPRNVMPKPAGFGIRDE